MSSFTLTLSCQDRVGIVHAVSGYLVEQGCNIVESQQFGDTGTGQFFMRVSFTADDEATDTRRLREAFAEVGSALQMDWQLHDAATRCRALVMVSKFGHCLNDLLYRWQIGALHADIVAIASNHPDMRPLAQLYGLPYHHLPVTPRDKPTQERALLELVDRYRVDLVVLARYMQVLSDDVCARMPGRIINIHHSFLPSFAGARPHRQAFERGVKLIGATAHYVTAELDEGPIIEQEVARVDHAHSPESLAAIGRDVESAALARAVQAHAQHRVLLNGRKTVVFR